ncbi:MAG: HAD-IIIC family phosphatase [Flavobacteriaceae bacterium]|nr:HAD-IIIC family phosphatase [Flavobacteriaceae bacterium]
MQDILESKTMGDLAFFIDNKAKIKLLLDEPIKLERNYYPVSYSQKYMWLIDNNTLNGQSHNINFTFKFDGIIDKEKFKNALLKLSYAQSVLRTKLSFYKGNLSQSIIEDFRPDITWINLFGEKKIDIDNIIKRFYKHRFELSSKSLWRVGVFSISPKISYVSFIFNHTIFDGASFKIFCTSLFNEYFQYENEAYKENIGIEYKDITVWQNKLLLENKNNDEKYWINEYNKPYETLRFPFDLKNKDSLNKLSSSFLNFTISTKLKEKIVNLSKRCKVSNNAIFLSAYILLLNQYSRQTEINIGLISDGRNDEYSQHLIGMFANFLPFKMNVKPQTSLQGFIKSVFNKILSHYTYQSYPFGLLVEKTKEFHKGRLNPFFDFMFVFHEWNNETKHLGLNDKIKFYPVNYNSNSGITFKLDVYNSDKEFECKIEYKKNCFDEDSVILFVSKYLDILNLIVNNVSSKIETINLFSAEEISANYRKIVKTKNDANFKLKIEISSTFTIDPIKPSIQTILNRFKQNVNIIITPYNQILQSLLFDNTNNIDYDLKFYFIRFEDFFRYVDGGIQKKIDALEHGYSKLLDIVQNTRFKKGNIFYFMPVDGLKIGKSLHKEVNHFKREFITVLNSLENVFVKDLTNSFDTEEVFDLITDDLGHVPYKDYIFKRLGLDVSRFVLSYFQLHSFKIIVVDCDNTLWKGIAGDDGVENVKFEKNHIELHKFLNSCYNKGMLLAISSKNDYETVKEVFDIHESKLDIRFDQFISKKINWKSKSSNLLEISKELNIGIDSFIFIDDNLKECYEVAYTFPDVLVLPVDDINIDFKTYLSKIWAFDKLKVTNEDKIRTQLYRADIERKKAMNIEKLSNNFTKTMALDIDLIKFNEIFHLDRVVQLTQRTNQFNLSIQRMNDEDVRKFIRNNHIIVIEVKDKFGSYGISGVVFFSLKQDELFIHNFILSCRVLGRNVEEAILNELFRMAKKENLKYINTIFKPTKRNTPVLQFLNRTSWILIKEYENENKLFRIDTNTIINGIKEIKITYREGYKERGGIIKLKNKGVTLKGSKQTNLTNNIVLWNKSLNSIYQISNQKKYLETLKENPFFEKDEHSLEKGNINDFDETEKLLNNIWQSILFGKNNYSKTSSFFAEGGDSVKVLSLISAIYENFEKELSIKDIFSNPTLLEQATLIQNTGLTEAIQLTKAEDKKLYKITEAQFRMYFLQSLNDVNTVYNNTVSFLIKGDVDILKLENTLNSLIERNEILRTVFHMENGEVYQRIVTNFQKINIEILNDSSEVNDIISHFIKPFNFSLFPLIRFGLKELAKE